MQSSARLFNCARCRRQVVICSHCDRGNRYCGKRCAQSRPPSIPARGRSALSEDAPRSLRPCRAPAPLSPAAKRESDASGFRPTPAR